MVFIAEIGVLSEAEINEIMASCVERALPNPLR
jgi:hypothetical protein